MLFFVIMLSIGNTISNNCVILIPIPSAQARTTVLSAITILLPFSLLARRPYVSADFYLSERFTPPQ